FSNMIKSPEGFYGIDTFDSRILEITPEGKFLKSYKLEVNMSNQKLLCYSSYMNLIFLSGKSGIIFAYNMIDKNIFWITQFPVGKNACATFNEVDKEKILFYVFKFVKDVWTFQTFTLIYQKGTNKIEASNIQENSDIT